MILGEIKCWRAYLLPKLRMSLSDRAALIITGVIWGIWHLPVIVMGHNYGTDYWGYPWLGILTMTDTIAGIIGAMVACVGWWIFT